MLEKLSDLFAVPSKKWKRPKLELPVFYPVNDRAHPLKLKIWSDKHLPPLAWNRILLKLLPRLKKENVWLHEIMEPDPSYIISRGAYDLIEKTIFDAYRVISK